MELQLKNIGMIKEANVKIDGLTVIAGENDTGKSTVGKALFRCLDIYEYEKKLHNGIKNKDKSYDMDMSYIIDIEMLKSSSIVLFDYENKAIIKINHDNEAYGYIDIMNIDLNFEPIFIETPLIWNFTDFFRDIALVESQYKVKLDYPYLMKDLNFKLHIKSATDGLDIKEKVTNLMGGEFKKDESDHYYFYKGNKKIELVNTATGIKTFGILQVLSQNNWLNKDTVLIFDEPEVHLHPKWQLEMAKILVELVANGVKIVVNSHSPYMIEALERYSKIEPKTKDKTNFYLAEDGFIKQIEDSNSLTLEKIFSKLSEPFEVFEEMDSESLEKLING